MKGLGHAGYPHGVVVFAEYQTAGRGRRLNKWAANPREDLLCSVLLRPEAPLPIWPRLTTIAALSIACAIEKCTELKPMIKWPNDVYLEGKKTAGILAETFTQAEDTFMVLGMGLNVNSTHWHLPAKAVATSLAARGGNHGQPLDREKLAIALFRELNRWCDHWAHGYASVIEEVRKRSWLLGREVTARMDDHSVTGRAEDLNEEGNLILRLPSGEKVVLTSAEQVRPI